MKEDKLLEGLARTLGVESVLTEMVEKKTKEK
jgi:hypothetical protein